MKPNVPAPSSTRQAAPPLRSTTVSRSPATNRSTSVKAGFDSIKLDTYHDSSSLKAALRELEAAFAAPEASTSAAASSASQASTSAPNTNLFRRPANTTPQTDKSSAAKPNITVIVQPKAGASPPPLPARRQKSVPSPFMQLPPQLILRCFSFCDLKALGVLCCVSIRLNVMVEQQGGTLWAAAALRHRIPIANAATARGELRRAMTARAAARDAEEAFYEAEIARMEERLRVRAEDVYAQNVDVNRTIATGGDSGGVTSGPATATSSTQPYWLRSQRTTDSGSAKEKKGDSVTSQLCTKLRSEIEALEASRRAWESKVSLQEGSLREQAAQLRQWQALLLPGIAMTPSATAASLTAPEGSALSAPLVSATELERFERRVARLVLNGAAATALTVADAGDEEDGIPAVLRRGVEDLATVELVLRVLGVHVAGGAAGSFAEAPQSEVRLSGAVRDAGRRWRAFQRVFPLNEDYESVRCFLVAQEVRGVLPTAAAGEGNGRPSTKQTPALLRVSGFVRRVERMTDSQVVQSWM